MKQQSTKYALIIPDGGADLYRKDGKSPLGLAEADSMNFIARHGVSGLMRTLYPDLPKESLVAQLGMLGWPPHQYYPNGRASCELLALEDIYLEEGDIAFRANLARMEGEVLVSYNADFIHSERARPLVQKINLETQHDFPEFKLYHNSDFRNTLIIRGARTDPRDVLCPEPHENQGLRFDLAHLIRGRTPESEPLVARLNLYLLRAAQILDNNGANVIFPWSASKVFQLPSFRSNTGFKGRTAIVGNMDFLHGIAKAGGISFFKLGNGRPDTDYRAKGAKAVELLADGYDFVVCHVNGPDEASHMGDLELKVKSLKATDSYVVRPIIEYFLQRPEELGGVMVMPDHYTNHAAVSDKLRRVQTHSAHPVPFTLWNNVECDEVTHYGEDEAAAGKYGAEPLCHLELLRLLGVRGA